MSECECSVGLADDSGEIILLIDSDTRVPPDCFMDASLEMLESPEVAIM